MLAVLSQFLNKSLITGETLRIRTYDLRDGVERVAEVDRDHGHPDLPHQSRHAHPGYGGVRRRPRALARPHSSSQIRVPETHGRYDAGHGSALTIALSLSESGTAGAQALMMSSSVYNGGSYVIV